MEQTIKHQPELKCCANCDHLYDEGSDCGHSCNIGRDYFKRTFGKRVDATDICEHFKLYRSE